MGEKKPKYPMADAVREGYQAGEDDETLEPRVLVDRQGRAIGRFRDGDYVIFYNLRGEREVELSLGLLGEDFPHFPIPSTPHGALGTIWITYGYSREV